MENKNDLNLFELNNKELIRVLAARGSASELVFSIFLLFLEEKGVIEKREFVEFIKMKSSKIRQSAIKDNEALAENLEEAVQSLLGGMD